MSERLAKRFALQASNEEGMDLPRVRQRRSAPSEYSLLYTAILCLLAFGAVMVYSSSSAQALHQSGDSFLYVKRYVVFALVGLVVMQVLARRGLALARRTTGWLLAIALVLTSAVMLPGLGVNLNGAARWLAIGPVQFEPSELLKLALVLYAARLLAARPDAVQRLKTIIRPLFFVVGASCVLVLAQPDMGTAFVILLAVASLLVAAGTPTRHLVMIAAAIFLLAVVLAIAMPYRRNRLVAFVHPWSDPSGTGFQIVQSMIAMGSGGFFGVGLGESVQKFFYLPEAHTDMILAIIGEELGVLGVLGVASLYGLIARWGLRTAMRNADRYARLVACGITSLVLCQAIVNFFAVMGMAPLTGVPLPLISYGSSNLIVLLGGMGLLLNASSKTRAERPNTDGDGIRPARPWGVVSVGAGGDRRRRNGRPRRARTGSGRSAAG